MQPLIGPSYQSAVPRIAITPVCCELLTLLLLSPVTRDTVSVSSQRAVHGECAEKLAAPDESATAANYSVAGPACARIFGRNDRPGWAGCGARTYA